MKLSIKGLALASGILWGLAMLGMGLANLIWSGYGQQFLQTMSSVYVGYHATRSIAEVIVGTLYGAVDGLVGGAVFAWLYNQFAKSDV
jgi:TRAP-type mannitol/chloroaromatic compound transport system permease large subunit